MDEGSHDQEATPMGGDRGRDQIELLGLFDVPAFAPTRARTSSIALARLGSRLGGHRGGMLEMVRLRLRQWAMAADGPRADLLVFDASIAGLWPLAGAEPPRWAARVASTRRLRSIGRDLVAAVERFNRRWSEYLEGLDLDPINRQVDDYNRYYLIEKECSLGSARLAARHFVPKARVARGDLWAVLPELPVPALKGGDSRWTRIGRS